MRRFLAERLRCPRCGGPFAVEAFVTDPRDQRVIDGVLRCACGRSFPVVRTIPRILEDAFTLFPEFVRAYGDRLGLQDAPPECGAQASRQTRLIERTRESFGYQWTTFSEMSCDFAQNFWNYLSPATPELLRGKVALDVGCGFGRHLYHAAQHCAEMIGVDLSLAIESADLNTRHLPNVHLVQADIYALPFAPGQFDLVYSVGVLHHLPDPASGLARLIPLLRPGGWIFVWLYSKKRWLINGLLEAVRLLTTRCPRVIVKHLSFLGAAIDYSLFVTPYQHLRAAPGPARRIAERLTPPRIKLYSGYPFQVMYADWFDRLAAPIRYYYSADEVAQLLTHVGVSDVRVSHTGLYGWRGCGVWKNGPVAAPEAAGAHGAGHAV